METTKLTKKVQLVGNVAKFNQSVKGGKLPSNFEVYIVTEIDFTGAKLEDLYTCCAGGSSARVQLQAQLRSKSIEELNRLSKEGLKVTFNDIIANKVSKPVDKLMALSKDDFIELMVDEMGFDADDAERVYNKKHGIVDDSDETEVEEEIEE